MKCAFCKKQIAERYILYNKKKYHISCYESHIAPRCHICKQIIDGQYAVSDSMKYHSHCYEKHLALKCSACRGAIAGKYIEDYWGNVYHAAHKDTLHKCLYCSRLICNELTDGGITYPDGRSVCNICFMTAIKEIEYGKAAIMETLKMVKEMGLIIEESYNSLELISTQQLAGISGKSHNEATQGSMLLTEEYINKKKHGRRLDVYILYGLPRMRFISVLAHEFTHVWIKLNCPKLPLKLEEGSANLISYLVLSKFNNSEAKYIIHTLHEDKNPVYGEGFRKALKMYKKMGLKEYLDYLKRKKPLISLPFLGF